MQARQWLVKGVIGHGNDRLIGRDKDRNVWFLMEHCFFAYCIACDLERALKQVKYMHHIYITLNSKSE